MRFAYLAFVGLVTAGCGVLQHSSGLMPRSTTAYRDIVTEDDRIRLRDWRSSFIAGLDQARKTGHGAEIAREGALLDPDAAIAGPALPNGLYRCRVIKLGARGPGNLPYVGYPEFTCRVRPDGTLQRLGKLGGSQRYVGLIFPADAIRSVFLGTLAFADDNRVLQYGQDDQRDVVGYVERIGQNRWRVVMPAPHFESRTDVMELIPQG